MAENGFREIVLKIGGPLLIAFVIGGVALESQVWGQSEKIKSNKEKIDTHIAIDRDDHDAVITIQAQLDALDSKVEASQKAIIEEIRRSKGGNSE